MKLTQITNEREQFRLRELTPAPTAPAAPGTAPIIGANPAPQAPAQDPQSQAKMMAQQAQTRLEQKKQLEDQIKQKQQEITDAQKALQDMQKQMATIR
jgi:TolA-binding protein